MGRDQTGGMRSTIRDRTRLYWKAAQDPRYTAWASLALLALEACLCSAIVMYRPYTEIDWKTYMQQASLFLKGERDYTRIEGDTGPCVYPAVHLYIYAVLHKVTDGGQDIILAKCIFAALYVGVLGTVMMCYNAAGAPPYLLLPLVLSLRMHSLYMLRFFNDSFAACALFLTIYAYQKRMWTLGNIAFSLGLGIKMTMLLATPAVGLILLQALAPRRAITALGLMAQIQLLIALPFLKDNAIGYLTRSFDFGRQFLFKWTVNWRFLGESIFLSPEFAIILLAFTAATLLIFISTRWIRPSRLRLFTFLKVLVYPAPTTPQKLHAVNIPPDFVLTTILSSVIIGLTFARSLHYQFFAYLGWSSPFLLWKSGMSPFLVYLVCGIQDWAWQQYPSTSKSSLAVISCLIVQICGAWLGTRNDFVVPRSKVENRDLRQRDKPRTAKPS